MSLGGEPSALSALLAQRFTLGGTGSSPSITYCHVTTPPVPGGSVGVPELVCPFLTITDGAKLFSSDDEELQEWGIPAYSAVMYDRIEIDHWTRTFREQLTDELRSWQEDGEMSEQRMLALVSEVSEYWAIGATVGGNSFVLGSFRLATC